jgi:hypothetical protein
MDIKSLAIKNTGRMHVTDASGNKLYDGKNKAVVIVLYSPASKEYAQAHTNRENMLVDMLRDKGKAEATVESKQESKTSFLVDCTHSFEGIEYDDLTGKELFNAVYSDRSIGFISDQANIKLNDWSNFTEG